MSFFSKISAALANVFSRKRREREWADRFTNPPASLDGKLPLDDRSRLS